MDVAIILGPTRPAPLAVEVLGWLNDPDLALRFRAAAGALLQLALVLLLLALWRLGERLAGRLARRAAWSGARRRGDGPARAAAGLAAALLAGTMALGLAGLAVWSVAGLWTFPAALPDAPSLRTWSRAAPDLAALGARTALIAALATAAALLLTLACLEAEQRRGIGRARAARALPLLYIPLVVPQATFLAGLQTLAIGAGASGTFAAVAAAHLVFVLPYVMLSLADPWRAWTGGRR